MKKIPSRAVGRPKDMEKRQAILQAAGNLFTSLGFTQASMEQVAQDAQVSKLTVYNHFGTKEQLFDAVVSSKCDQFFGGKDFSQFAHLPAEQALSEIGTRFMQLLFSEEVVRMHRMLISSATSHPELCQRFYAAGPQQALGAMTALLTEFAARGELSSSDPAVAAEQFFALFHGQLHWRVLLGLTPEPSTRQRHALLEGALKVMRATYGLGAASLPQTPQAKSKSRTRRITTQV